MDPYRTPAQAAAKLLVVPQAGGGLDMVLAFGTSIDAGADRTRVPADVVARYCAAVAPLPPPPPSYKAALLAEWATMRGDRRCEPDPLRVLRTAGRARVFALEGVRRPLPAPDGHGVTTTSSGRKAGKAASAAGPSRPQQPRRSPA